jgi:hypothetical protein
MDVEVGELVPDLRAGLPKPAPDLLLPVPAELGYEGRQALGRPPGGYLREARQGASPVRRCGGGRGGRRAVVMWTIRRARSVTKSVTIMFPYAVYGPRHRETACERCHWSSRMKRTP